MEKSLGTFCDKCLGDNLIGHNIGGVEKEKKRVCHRMRPNLFRHSVTQGVGWSHAISDSVAWSRDVTNWAGVAVAVELIMAHVMAVETGSPISYMGVKEGFIILCQGEVRGVGGMVL